MKQLVDIVHGIGAALACASCFYLAGLTLTPRRWDRWVGAAAKAILGGALYILLCWIAISAQRIPLTFVAAVFGGGVLLLSIVRMRRVAAALREGVASETLRSGVLVFVFFYVLIYALTWPPTDDVFLPPAWSGNRDLLTHIRYAKHLLMFGSPDLDAANFDYLRSPAVSHLLAGFSLAFNQDPLAAAMPALFALVALIGVSVVSCCRSVFSLPMRTAIVIACIVITNPYFKHIASVYQLPTLTAIPILLFLLWLTVRSMRGGSKVEGPLVATLTGSYAILFFTDIPTLIAALMVQAVLARGLLLSSAISISIVAVPFVDRLWWSFNHFEVSSAVRATILVLGIVLLGGVAHVVRREDVLSRFARTPTDRRLTVAAIGYAAIALVVGNVAVHASRDRAPLRMPGRWRGIEQLRNAHFGEITLKIEHDPNGLLASMTRYFLPDKEVHIIAPRVRVRDLPFETVSRQSPIIIQNFGCDGIGHLDMMTIPGVGCVVFAPPAFELDKPYPFNRTFLFLGVDGMGDREPGGRWNTGRTVSLTLVVDPERVPVDRNLYLSFFVNPLLPPDVQPQGLTFKWGSNRAGETHVDAESWVSVPISAGDWNGNRVWRLPMTIGLPDRRTMLFHDLLISEIPRGRVVQ